MHHAPDDAPDDQPAKRTDWSAVERDYLTGQYTNRELAAKHGCSHTQVSRRAKLYGWLRVPRVAKGDQPAEPAPQQPTRQAHKPRAQPPAEQAPVTRRLLARAGAVDPTVAATTPTEEAFITEYLSNGMNATAAAVAVFGHGEIAVAKATGWQILRRPRVVARIAAERARLAATHEMSRDQLLAEFLAIVRADPNELMQMRAVACDECWPSDTSNRGRWMDPDPDCMECMGEGDAIPWFADTRKLSPEARALFAGVKITKDGATILTHDKMAALVNIGKILGAYEKDNDQKRPALTEALAQFFGQLHGEGAGRLQFAPRKPAQANTPPEVKH